MRFSKQAVAGTIDGQLEGLAREFFEETGNPYNVGTGSHQVEGLSDNAQRLYSAINTLEELIDRIEVTDQSRVWAILIGEPPLPTQTAPLKPSPPSIPDSPALAYIGKGSYRQAIGWVSCPEDLRGENGTLGAIVLYEGESTSEGFGGQEDCEPSDAEQCVGDLDSNAGFEWAATQEAADWYSIVYGREVTLAQLEKGTTDSVVVDELSDEKLHSRIYGQHKRVSRRDIVHGQAPAESVRLTTGKRLPAGGPGAAWGDA